METAGAKLVALNGRVAEACLHTYGLGMEEDVKELSLALHVRASSILQADGTSTPPTTPTSTVPPKLGPSRKRALFQPPCAQDFPQWVNKIILLAEAELKACVAALVKSTLCSLVDGNQSHLGHLETGQLQDSDVGCVR